MSTPHAIKVDGQYHLSAAMSFFMLAHYGYEDFDPQQPDAPSGLRAFVGRVLTKARAGGFARSDLFLTLLANREESQRMIQLAQEAVTYFGGDDEFLAFVYSETDGVKGGAA